MIPSMMVDRIETCGRRSAVYAPKPSRGVVNIIMKRRQDGFEFDVQAGMSEEATPKSTASPASGATLLQRPPERAGRRRVGAPRADHAGGPATGPSRAFGGNSTLTPQPIIPNSRSNTTPFGTFQLRSGTNPFSVTLDTRDRLRSSGSGRRATPTVAPTCQDPCSTTRPQLNALQGNVERGSVRGYADFALTDNINVFGELS
jgi:hypothetical protein